MSYASLMGTTNDPYGVQPMAWDHFTSLMKNRALPTIPGLIGAPAPMDFSSMRGWNSGIQASIPEFAESSDLGNAMKSIGALPTVNGGGAADWMPAWLKSAIGTKDQPGWGGLALGAAQFGLGAYTGLKQLGLAKDSLNFQKYAFEENLKEQKAAMRASAEGRYRSMLSGAGANSGLDSLDTYMNKHWGK